MSPCNDAARARVGYWFYVDDNLGLEPIYDGTTGLVIQLNGGNRAKLILDSGEGWVDGITEDLEWTFEAKVKLIYPSSGNSCTTPGFGQTRASRICRASSSRRARSDRCRSDGR